MSLVKSLLFSLLVFTLSFTTSSGFGQNGNCNDEDLDYLSENMEFVQNLVASCGSDCAFDNNPEGCLQVCLESQTPLSVDCIECFNEQMTCALNNCFFPCGFGSDADCADCLEENCLDLFFDCAGIVDNDGDGFTNLEDCDDMNPSINPDAEEIWYDGVDQNCDGLSDFDQDGDGEDSVEFGGLDCDDQDPGTVDAAFVAYPDSDGDGFGTAQDSIITCTLEEGFAMNNTDCDDADETIYPGAPGTGEGVDNNCNGFLDPEELPEEGCIQDLDNDGLISSADLLIILGDFGCESNCESDMNGDTVINSEDLLVFLSLFGSSCSD